MSHTINALYKKRKKVMTNLIDTLKERGFIEAITSDDLFRLLEKPTKVYCGFDPTADSLHLGNLVAIMGLAWFQRFGHTPVAIVGGATGMIGDPSGKSTERHFLTEETLQHNLKGIKKNLETILNPTENGVHPIILNNFDWYSGVTFIEFLREIGVMFRLGPMLSKESVRLRLQSEEGMSFTEFSYQILQGYDFLHLYKKHGVEIQLGGADQWGNITAGTDLIRKVEGKSAYGITFSLLTKSDGQKFGKSEKGAIWLSPEKVSPYEFYQHLIRVEDADVIKLMKMLTFMEMEEIHFYEKEMQKVDYAPRTAQKKLAEEVTRLVHGEEGFKIALAVTEGVSPGSDTRLDANLLEILSNSMPSYLVEKEDFLGVKLIEFLVTIGLQSSKNDARRLIRNGGLYLNNQKIEDENFILSEQDLLEHRILLLAAGKKNKMIVRMKSSIEAKKINS